jgi:hypothetical protein
MESGPLAAMDTSFEDFAGDVGDHLGDVQDASDDTLEQIQLDAQEMVGVFDGVLDAVVTWEDQYSQTV